MKKKQLIVIVGPTGVGKTSVSIALAKHLKTEIISADSRQIYKQLVIGTAAITPKEMEGIPHHFIGSLDVRESFNAFEYEKAAISLIEKLFQIYDTLIMVGGSMMYIDAVCKGIDEMPDVDMNIREELKKQVEEQGIELLWDELKNADLEYYNSVDLKNPARVIHGLEVYKTTGRPISSFRQNKAKERNFNIIKTGIDLPRAELYNRIDMRVDKMIEDGLEAEAHSFYSLKDYYALKTVGYREFFDYFDDKITRKEAIRLIKRNSRHYAKKQLTWFRKDEGTQCFSPYKIDTLIEFIEEKII